MLKKESIPAFWRTNVEPIGNAMTSSRKLRETSSPKFTTVENRDGIIKNNEFLAAALNHAANENRTGALLVIASMAGGCLLGDNIR